MRWVIVVAIGLAIAGCGGRKAPPPASGPVTITSPGPLIAGHATLACEACHDGPTPAVIAARCVSCHAPLRARIAAGRGFHTTSIVRGKPCETCHRDHRGASFDALGWSNLRGGRDGFDHALTGWPLDGAHRTVACETCHVANPAGKPVYVGTDPQCVKCHADTRHGFTSRDLFACERCHDTAVWRPALPKLTFDHGSRNDARVPLVGKHRDVACAACHPDARFNLALADPMRCETCHTSPHAQRPYGKIACARCHDARGFTDTGFDHAEVTKFALGDSHRHLACLTCHTPALGTALPRPACESCHAQRSPHKQRFDALGKPAACGLCHVPNTKTWRPTMRFDHTKVTGWALTSKHATLSCRDCHRGATPDQFERLKSGNQCMSCHAHAKVHADDAHPNGRFTNAQCLNCHVPVGQFVH